jgi:hypothetical protein
MNLPAYVPTFFVLLLANTLLAATDSPPRFTMLPSTSEDSALTMECAGSAPFQTMRCQFVQTSLSQNPKEQLLKELNDERKAKDFGKVVIQKLIEIKKECTDATRKVAEDFFSVRQLSKEKQQTSSEEIDEMFELCECAGKVKKEEKIECFFFKRQKGIERLAATCRIETNSFSLDFKKVSDRKWISNAGPAGLCNFVTVATVEADPPENGSAKLMWKFTQIRTAGDMDNELCKKFQVNTPSVFWWKAPGRSRRTCGHITF